MQRNIFTCSAAKVLIIFTQILRTYKDKVYPEKALTIAQLQNDIQNLSQNQKVSENDLQNESFHYQSSDLTGGRA